ncbi:AAA family ATPase [Yoonia vestfoldensis]|uniref:AAA family ATPase n=1 Tax=Yoonia vestfoldensis TaxID=245188 RepID=UPI00039C95F9|nr:AAA family ATPase [Yoonia vestfoldensis]
MGLQQTLDELLGIEKINAAQDADLSGVEKRHRTATNYVKKDSASGQANQAVSWLDLPLPISLFRSKTDTHPTHDTLSLRQFVDRAASVTAADKGTLPLVKLGTFTGGRKAEHLHTRHGIEIDYDAGEVQPAEAAARLRAANVAAVVVTSSSHAPDAPRWRVLVPTSAPISVAESAVLVERVNGALGGIAGRESFDPARCYFYGSVGTAASEVHLIDGRPIDKAPELPRIGKVASQGDLLANLLGPATPAPADDDDLFAAMQPDWDRIKGALKAIKNADDRDRWLTIGQALHHDSQGSPEGLRLWSVWSKRSAKYSESDQLRTWASFGSRKGEVIGIGSLYHIAKAEGWTGADPMQPSRLSFLSPADCEAAPARGYILKGMVAPGDVACIVGAPGAGKSLLAPYLAYMVAQGSEAFSMRSKAGGVLYVAAEDPHGMRGRIKALRATYGDAPAFRLVEGVSNLLIDQSPDLAALLEAVEQQRPTLIVIDTLAMAFPALEENSAEGMGRVVAAARSLTKWGAAVVLIHHDTKDGQQGLPRGHSLLNGALDVALHIKRDDNGVVKGRLTKNRNGPCDLEIAFTIGTIDAGHDEDGDTIRLPYAAPCAFVESAAPKLSRSEKAVMAHFEDLAGDGFEADERELRQVCVDGRGVSSADNPDSRRRTLDNALRGLIDKGVLIVTEN